MFFKSCKLLMYADDLCVMLAMLDQYKKRIFEHPPYCPDLPPCDFHIFGPVEKALKGGHPIGRRRTKRCEGILQSAATKIV